MASSVEEICQLYELAKSAVTDVRNTVEGLNRSRSVTIEVYNPTATNLRQVGSHHGHGGFAVPPKGQIKAGEFDVFASTSSADSVAAGTKGYVVYGGDGGGSFKVSWNNPFIGSNDCSAETGGNDGRFRAIANGGAGHDAKMSYILFAFDHPVVGAIRQKYAGVGWEGSALGYPQGPELATFDGTGRSQQFQGGIISWHPETGAQIVQGLIGQRWLVHRRIQMIQPAAGSA